MNADQFNALYPVGTPVFAYPGFRPEDASDARQLVTRTRTAAQLSPSGDPVVWVEGEGSYICLTRVDPVPEDVWEVARAAEKTAEPSPAEVPVRLDDQRLAEALAAYKGHPDLGFACCSAHAVADHVPALRAEVQRLKAELAQAREAALTEAADWFDRAADAEPDQSYRARVMRGAANDVRRLVPTTNPTAEETS